MTTSSSTVTDRPSASLLRTVRKRLGRVKCVVVDRWAYIPLEKIADRRRAAQRPSLAHLPALPAGSAYAGEVHMLCGHRDADMGIWASWSLLRFLPGMTLHVHSDGTLTADDHAAWTRVIPATVFTTPEQREASAQKLSKDFPAVHRWRTVHVCGSKFVDFHLFGQSDRIVLLDSDVVCFSDPRELIAALKAPAPSLRWNADCATSYSATPEALSEILGFTVPARVNSGFLLAKRWTNEDFAWFDAMLNTLLARGVPIYDRWAEQMLYAIAAGRHAVVQAFPADYAVALGRTKETAVVRHYVGVPRIRPRFHTEAIPRLQAQLRSAGEVRESGRASGLRARVASVETMSP